MIDQPTFLTLAALLLGAAAVTASEAEPRVLRKEVIVGAPLDEVWRAWTTNEGLTFISAESDVRLEPGGPYEWFLDGPADDEGRRGSAGSRVLAFLPEEMLAFAWTFPPSIPTLRSSGATTQVVVLFDEPDESGVRVRLAQHGWGDGPDWDAGWSYFDAAWSSVLARLEESLEASGSSSSEGSATR